MVGGRDGKRAIYQVLTISLFLIVLKLFKIEDNQIKTVQKFLTRQTAGVRGALDIKWNLSNHLPSLKFNSYLRAREPDPYLKESDYQHPGHPK
jgi:hypothetical protein